MSMLILSILDGVSAERVLVEFANRGFITLGKGMFLRHASPLDFVKPTNAVTDEPDNISEAAEPVETSHEALEGEVLPLVLLSSDDCKQCEHVSAKLNPKQVPLCENDN